MHATLSASLLPLPTASLTESIAGLLRERIVDGQFQPGEKLVEAEIARQLQISRGPVREALAQLRAEGLVIERPRRGSFVAELTLDDVREIYELRAALESRAARLLIERDDREALVELGVIVEAMKAATGTDDREAFAELDARFHAELCRLSGNQRLHRAFVQQAGLLNVFLRLEIKTQYRTLAGILAEHVELFADLDSGDRLRAEAGCDRHMREALERVTSMLAQPTS
ncbi:MAG TPA: GntR family transcriptional regulator [Solirubrobacteraceae bacterium]|nr:GntR family transcriptional regulator [Solirubrobacteraceae bacterium]